MQLITGVIVGLVLGSAGGYLYGSYSAVQSINEQIAAMEKANAEASVNPYAEVETNPLEGVKTNPYENVRLNPFD